MISPLRPFGGTPGVSHYATDLRRDTAVPRKLDYERRAAERAILTAAGLKDVRYFQFRDDDARRKSAAKLNATRYAAKVKRLTGIELTVYEGCFL